MSAYYNNLFTVDPVAFIKTYTVDIKTWFENLGRGKTEARRVGARLVDAANALGACRVDFAPVGGVFGFGVSTVQLQFVQHAGVDAYWVPYHAGGGLPGHCDVPRGNPASNFVFTAGMNGCAFVITDSPKGAGYMRVYHHQHPNENSVWQAIHNAAQNIISYTDFEDYGGPPLAEGMNPVAFNFLYYRNATWVHVFQPQQFSALSQAPAQRLIGLDKVRSAF